jgi:Rrf2 family protein
VDLTLTRTADYAVRAAIALAEAWGDGYRTIREVATEMELPPSFTPQVLGLLARAGIAESKPGRGGGYRLVRPPRRISMLEVVEAAEGPLANERCTLRGGPCRWDDHCAVHDTWTRAREALRGQLARTSLAAVAAEDRLIAGR